jgi:hypothetical protein
LDYFGQPSENVTTAYIVWALTSTGEKGLTTELSALGKIANGTIKSKNADPYFLGLLASSYYNLGSTSYGNYYAD